MPTKGGKDIQIGEDHINGSNPFAEHRRLERRQESRDEEDDGENGDDQVENRVDAMVFAMHKVGVETHGDDAANPLHGSGGQEDGPREG